MEVKNYLGYSLLIGQMLTKDIKNYANALNKFFNSFGFYNEARFYSQEFSPELIPKYFKGWEIVPKTFQFECRNYINENIQVAIMIVDEIRVEIFKRGYNSKIIKPRTLDDFINDCQRASVTLEWNIPEEKEEEKLPPILSDF